MSGWFWPRTLITRVVDGDTVDALVTRDLGFNGTVTFPVRLRIIGVNTPAMSTRKGKTAAAFVTALVDGARVDVTTLKPYKYGGPATAVGEWMAKIVLPDGNDLSALMIEHGHAVAWDGTGPRPSDG
jgi:endonuclease YncB( thermonuclease family)